MTVAQLEIEADSDFDTRSPPWRVGDTIAPEDFEAIRRRLMLEHCKWDSQVGDVSTIAPFAFILRQGAWQQLSKFAEALFSEMVEAEQELFNQPKLIDRLGLPRKLKRALIDRNAGALTPGIARIARFDFHWTDEGWQISEVNSDVPGGFCEASSLSAMMAQHYAPATIAGDVADTWATAMATKLYPGADVALVCAVGYMEDQQVTAYLAKCLKQHRIKAHLVRAIELGWESGGASIMRAGKKTVLDAIVRFYQGEWLVHLPNQYWRCMIRGGRTPICNPPSAILSESKRFPLVWHELGVPMSTWRKLLPESRDPREVNWRKDPRWLLKSAFCNNGDDVICQDWLAPRDWRRASLWARLRPSQWVAQRRFASIVAETAMGPMYPCIGVYVIDGEAAGAYGRLSAGPVVNYSAIDVAILVDPENSGGSTQHE